MNLTNRRTVLGSAAALAGLPLLNDLSGRGRTAVAATTPPTPEMYDSYTHLFNSKVHLEGRNWARRYRRSVPAELIDNANPVSEPFRNTAIIAPHGGSIEEGTSELCLAIAGYTLTGPGAALPSPVQGVPQRDYWMFEGLTDPTTDLHVTSTHCDDPAALHICGSNMYAVSVHGFDEGELARKIIIGGVAEDPGNPNLNELIPTKPSKRLQLKKNMKAALAKQYQLGASNPALAVEVVYADPGASKGGYDPENIVNRTRCGFGVQLEISRPLRAAMFGDIGTAASRRSTAGVGSGNQGYFWNGFVTAVREAVDDYERGIITSSL